MAITYQATPTFTIDAVDLSAWVTAGAVTHTFENLDATTYAVDYRTFQPGLQSNSATITLFLDYAAAATYATLAPACRNTSHDCISTSIRRTNSPRTQALN